MRPARVRGTSDELSHQAEEEFRHGSLPKSRAVQEASVARLREKGKSQVLVYALARLSHFSLLAGDLDHDLAAADQGLTLAIELGDDLGRAQCMRRRGDVFFLLGRTQDALAAYDQAEPLYLKVGNDLGRANCVQSRGNVLFPAKD